MYLACTLHLRTWAISSDAQLDCTMSGFHGLPGQAGGQGMASASISHSGTSSSFPEGSWEWSQFHSRCHGGGDQTVATVLVPFVTQMLLKTSLAQ